MSKDILRVAGLGIGILVEARGPFHKNTRQPLTYDLIGFFVTPYFQDIFH